MCVGGIKLSRAGTTGYPSGRKLVWSLSHIIEKINSRWLRILNIEINKTKVSQDILSIGVNFIAKKEKRGDKKKHIYLYKIQNIYKFIYTLYMIDRYNYSK